MTAWTAGLLLGGVLGLSPPAAQAPLPKTEALSGARVRSVESAVRRLMDREKVPALSLAIALDGRLSYARAFGLADLENDVPAGRDTVFRFASVSKPITAVAVLQLSERGKVDLDSPVRRYVPGFPEKPWPVTVRHLLCHQGGIRHYRPLWFEVNHTFHYERLAAALSIFRDDPLVAEPGTKYHYTTFGYVLLGAAVESITGKRFEEHLREAVLRPAGMSRTAADAVHAIVRRRARNYRLSAGGRIENCDLVDTSYKIPGGGLAGTAEDLVRFALAVRDGVLLRNRTVEAMWTRQKLRDGTPTGYGLGWDIGERDGAPWVSHGGNQNGASAFLGMLPREGFVVAVLANREEASLPALAGELLGLLLPAR